MAKVYIIGSLKNQEVPEVANKLRKVGHEVFDDWYAAGPEADDYWHAYELKKGHNYKEALAGYSAKDVFNFDKYHLDRTDVAVLVLPAGKSGHLELGYAVGNGKIGYILLDDPDRWDVMYQFATDLFYNVDDLIKELKGK